MRNFTNLIGIYFIRVTIGRIIDIKNNIISVSGLSGAFIGELVFFKDSKATISGVIVKLEIDICHVVLLCGDQQSLNIGEVVYRTREVVKHTSGWQKLLVECNTLFFNYKVFFTLFLCCIFVMFLCSTCSVFFAEVDAEAYQRILDETLVEMRSHLFSENVREIWNYANFLSAKQQSLSSAELHEASLQLKAYMHWITLQRELYKVYDPGTVSRVLEALDMLYIRCEYEYQKLITS